MKTIYTKENFMHINSEYTANTFNVFFDNTQHILDLNEEADYLNIPINKYSYVSFSKQYAKYISISNQRKLTEKVKENYEQLGFKKYKDITFAEVINGTPDNLIFLFTETDEYIDKFQDIAFDALKPNTKLIVLKDDYLQYGSNYLFRNNGELLVDSIKSFIKEKSNGFDLNNISIIGSRTAGKVARLYGELFPRYKLITFNTEADVFKTEEQQYVLDSNGLSFRDSFEITSFAYDNLTSDQLKGENILINTETYSFVETMKLVMFYTQIMNNRKMIITLKPISIEFIGEVCKLPNDIESKPLFAYLKTNNIVQKLNVFAYGGEYYLKQTELISVTGCVKLMIITENIQYQISVKGW